MSLIGVGEDDTFRLVRGFEHHTYMCSKCGDIERRFVFNKHSKEPNAEAILTLPAIAPASTIQNRGKTTQGFLSSALAKVRG